MANRRARRSSSELKRLAVETARLTYEQGLDPAVVARHLGLRGTRDVNALLQRAKSLVQVRVEAAGVVPAQDFELAQRLKNALHLRHAFVVDVGEMPGHRGAAPDNERDGVDKALYQALGQVAGDFLLTIARPDDKIGIAAGRSVGFAAEHVAKTLHTGAETDGSEVSERYTLGGEVYSLGGGSFLEAYTRGYGRGVYIADFNAHTLAAALGSERVLCALRAYRENREQRDRIVKEDAPHLADKKLVLDIALYGATVVDSGHHVLCMGDDDLQAKAIAPQREHLARIVEQAPNVVFDECEHFYGSRNLPEELRGDVQAVVEGLNDRIVAVQPEVLGSARERILVAGGADKFPAVSELTHRSWRDGPRPTVLITDAQTAQALVQ